MFLLVESQFFKKYSGDDRKQSSIIVDARLSFLRCISIRSQAERMWAMVVVQSLTHDGSGVRLVNLGFSPTDLEVRKSDSSLVLFTWT